MPKSLCIKLDHDLTFCVFLKEEDQNRLETYINKIKSMPVVNMYDEWPGGTVSFDIEGCKGIFGVSVGWIEEFGSGIALYGISQREGEDRLDGTSSFSELSLDDTLAVSGFIKQIVA